MAKLTDKDRENLVAYLDGELSDKARSDLEAKLSKDAEARAEAEDLQRTWDLLEYLPRTEPSPEFTSRTLERITAQVPTVAWKGGWAKWHRPLWAAGWAAGLLLVAILGYSGGTWFSRRTPPTIQEGEIDPQLVRDLRLIETFPLYEPIDDLDFLRQLAAPAEPDLFAEDNTNS